MYEGSNFVGCQMMRGVSPKRSASGRAQPAALGSDSSTSSLLRSQSDPRATLAHQRALGTDIGEPPFPWIRILDFSGAKDGLIR